MSELEEECLKLIVNTQWFFGGQYEPMCINIVNISRLLEISKYKARKTVKSLKEKNLIELVCRSMNTEEEAIPPYWGYQPTKFAFDNNDIVKSSMREYEKSLREL